MSVILKNLCAAGIDISARLESYSYIPVLNMPTTLNFSTFGAVPIGVTLPNGDTTSIVSPRNTARFLARSFPITMPSISASPSLFWGVFKNCNPPSFILFAKSVTLASISGSIPRIATPETLFAEVSIT